MELLITLLGGESHRLSVDPGATVGQLKQQIALRLSIPVQQQRLSFSNGISKQLDNDSKRIRDYGLNSGAHVMLLVAKEEKPQPFQVFVKNEKGQTTTYDVTEDETVSELQRKVQNKCRTPVDQQRLIYSGRQMESNLRLRDYNVTNGSTIHMTLRLRGG